MTIRLEEGAGDGREEAYACLDALDDAPRESHASLALKAIRADPTLVDAYLAAADAAPRGSIEAVTAWLAAREIARRDAGARIQADAGRLWSNVFGRPYMRACAGYAACCFDRREFDEAIAQCKQLLILDDGDPMEAAPLLGACLLRAGDKSGFEAFREQRQQDGRTAWLYIDAFHAATSALQARTCNARIDRAIRSNRHVPTCLWSQPVEAGRIPYAAPGDGNEALFVSASSPATLWRNHPAALRVLLRRAAGIVETLAD